MGYLYAVICADVVNSTSLDLESMRRLRSIIDEVFSDIRLYRGVKFWGRVVKGDSIECCFDSPMYALRVAMALKCRMKWWASSLTYGDEELKHYGLRFSIGIGEMRIVDPYSDIMDGEAVYVAGRSLNMLNRDGETSAFAFVNADIGVKMLLESNIRLIDEYMNAMSARQCAVVYYKLLGFYEKEISEVLNLSQPAVSLRAKGASWPLLNKALKIIESLDYGRYV